MIRATTGGVMRTYRYNLMNSFINMNKGMNTMLSQRTFNSFAEDPAAAARAFRLRKARMTLESQYDICTDTHKKYETAVACLQSIDEVMCTKDGEYGYYMKTLTGTTLSMLNDPEGDAREQLAKVLDQMSRQIIQTMNQKYGDNFIFAGADGHNVPFEIVGDKLYYRGVPVDASLPNVLQNKNGLVTVNKNGMADPTVDTYYNMDNAELVPTGDYSRLYDLPAIDPGEYSYKIEVDPDTGEILRDEDTGEILGEYVPAEDGSGEYYKLAGSDEYISKSEYEAIKARQNTTWLEDENGDKYVYEDENGDTYYVVFNKDQLITQEDYEARKLDWEKLQYLAGETQFVDIGYGFQEDPVTGKLIESSAFDAALNGINFLGYGLDKDGDPKNIYSLVQKMKQISESVPSGTDWSTETWHEFDRLVGKFEKAVSNYQTEFVNLDASTGKLKSQAELLEENRDNVWEQYSNIEDVDMAEAITAFLWAQYSYNAALKVGNSVLSQSLMDYLS